jgi:hypothetical protein
MRGFYRLDSQGRIETAPGWHGHPSVDGRVIDAHTDALGLRGERALPPKAPGERRVLMLGDSFVWGIGVGDAETVPAELERQLRAGGADVRTGNAGMYGTGPREWGYTLERFRTSFAPDLAVAVMYVGNDVLDTLQEPMSVVDGWVLPAGFAGAARTSFRFRLTVASRLWYHVEKLLFSARIMSIATPPQVAPPGLSLDEALFLDRDPATDGEQPFLAAVEDKLAACFRDFAAAANGLPSLVVLLPAHEVALQPYADLLQKHHLDPQKHARGNGHARLTRLLAAAGLQVLDLGPAMLARADRRTLYLQSDWHLSVAGCAAVAGWLVDEVQRRLPLR